MEAPKLKPCPFCGETPTDIWQYGWRHYPNPSPLFSVRHSCTPEHGDSKELAAEKWNTRADLIDKDVLRQVEAVLASLTAAEADILGYTDLIVARGALTALRAMMEKLK